MPSPPIKQIQRAAASDADQSASHHTVSSVRQALNVPTREAVIRARHLWQTDQLNHWQSAPPACAPPPSPAYSSAPLSPRSAVRARSAGRNRGAGRAQHSTTQKHLRFALAGAVTRPPPPICPPLAQAKRASKSRQAPKRPHVFAQTQTRTAAKRTHAGYLLQYVHTYVRASQASYRNDENRPPIPS
jgi:hypothetical protein